MGHGRTRARTGAGLLASGLVLIIAGLGVTTAVASGEFTAVVLTSPLSGTSTTFTWSYTFYASGGHDLSNIAIRFCSDDILSHVVSASPNGEAFTSGDVPGGHTGFGPGIKFDTTAVTGALSVTFDQPYGFGPTGIEVQSHSGDGQVGDTITFGSGPLCPGTTTTQPSTTTTQPATTTTSTTQPSTTTTKPSTTTTTQPATTTTAPATTTTQPATTTTAPATTTTKPATTTTAVVVLPTTTVAPTTSTTAPATTTTTATSTTTTTLVATAVLGEVETRDPGAPPASLARTGSGALIVLVGLGLVLSSVGAALLIGEVVARRPEYEYF